MNKGPNIFLVGSTLAVSRHLVSFATRRRIPPPLPAGEGRGEGEPHRSAVCRKTEVSLSVVVLLVVTLASTLAFAAETGLQEFLVNMQSQQDDVRRSAMMSAGKVGPSAIAPLADLVEGNNREVSLSAQAALKNIAAYAGRPGAADEKKAAAKAYSQLLGNNRSRVLRSLVLELLSITGDDAVVPSIAALLGDTVVRDDARRALQGIPGPASLKALITAAQKTEGPFRASIIGALGQRNAPEAKDALIEATGSADLEVVLEALDAIARLGLERDDRIRLPSWNDLNEAQKTRFANAWLCWGEQRAAKGAVEDALEVYQSSLDNAATEHIVCAALLGLAKVAPDRAATAAIKSLSHESTTVQATAAQILEQAKGDETQVGELVKAYGSAKAAQRETMLKVLSAWNAKKLAE